MGCADKQNERNSNLGSMVTEEYENIKYQAITTSKSECCIQKISLENATPEQCKRIVIPERIRDYKVTKISGTIDEEDATEHNVFGDILPVDGGGWVCKEPHVKSENVVKEIIVPDTVLKLDPNNTKYQLVDGLLLSKEGTTLYGILPNNNSVTIPENVVDLANNALETDSVVKIKVAPGNPMYGQEGQCIYKKENGLKCIESGQWLLRI